jgi:hypothetical protein
MAEEWDRRLKRIKGFQVLEGERERKMAMELEVLLGEHDKVLAVIDKVRVDGTLAQLGAMMKEKGHG